MFVKAFGSLTVRFPYGGASGFPVMEVGIETGKINKNERKEKKSRNSYLGHKHTENSGSHCLLIASDLRKWITS
jgi:hypothetical protein